MIDERKLLIRQLQYAFTKRKIAEIEFLRNSTIDDNGRFVYSDYCAQIRDEAEARFDKVNSALDKYDKEHGRNE